MKKKLCLFVMLMAMVSLALAQQRQLTGKVTGDNNSPLPFATVQVKGTTSGTTTDQEGHFKLSLPAGGSVLVVRSVGYLSREVPIGTSGNLTISLTIDDKNLQEVVVTALNVKREKKSLGYSVQEIKGAELNQTKDANFVNSLSGKIAGIQVTGTSGNMGGSARITVRGINSIYGNNNPLFVVDGVPMDNSNFTGKDDESGLTQERGRGGYDYGNAIQDINPSDIESLSVLKGAAASALYGTRGSNGVIVITTKKSKAGASKGLGVTYNFGAQIEKVYIMPRYQNKYGGGYDFDTLYLREHPEAFKDGKATYDDNDGKGPYDLVPNTEPDVSWGPKFDGKPVRHWWSWDADKQNPDFGVTAPWEAHPNNNRSFFETGLTLTNNIAVSGANEKGAFRLAYTNMDQKFVLPNSSIKRNTISFNGSYQIAPRLEAFINANYTGTQAKGRPGTGYHGRNIMQTFSEYGHRDWDMEKLKDYYYPFDGSQKTWNRAAWNDPSPKYSDNPYWTRYKNFQTDRRDRVYGSAGINFKITEQLTVSGKFMTDFYTDSRQERVAIGSQGIPSYSEATRFVRENNYEGRINYNNTFGKDFSLSAFAGINRRENTIRLNGGESKDGLNIDGWYNLANSRQPAKVYNREERLRENGVFASASLGYRGFAYLDATGRNEWSSTLPAAHNSYFFPSVSGSLIFSELGKLKSSSWLSFGKLRLGWAQVGKGTVPYSTLLAYYAEENFGPTGNITVPDKLNNENIRPEITTEVEAGLELRFFQNRLGIEVSAYDKKSRDQIIPLTISASSGYKTAVINAGLIRNKGIEIAITGSPIRSNSGFNWDLAFNIARNRNKIEKLYEDAAKGIRVTNLLLADAPFAVSVNAREGEAYGSVVGYAIKRDAQGRKLVGADGMYIRADKQSVLGNALPDYTGGLASTLSYKGFSLGLNFDFQIGGKYFSTTTMFGRSSGLFEETAEGDIRETGVVAEGYTEDGKVNTKQISAYDHFNNNNGYVIQELDMWDASYLYLKEINLGYTFQKSFVERIRLQQLRLSFSARNVWLIYTENPHLDPTNLAISAGNVQGIEAAVLPSVRSFGVNLSVSF
ncbi:SusC/RagA family TonB-linked outer membrane protein [Chitinophaga nivalis]|uniref:SusC/RagA family TonB-linked outer membrane protein n=1 Tax=Chitinophaga nivalis TaxID=2991709 RepID=A0ABT3IMS8_9BACT|nr:SusC/RagA family TonB-linked outer membrane protein [Chitinophaga nivalis]MCW3465097.1 SusC/RagA family TonB-linked outer membrane protein [Chitinophaga nivalis]MCW3485211.1 SusC/RagA family TonB-linked outer membrane protein [Chitinophaga nivalis]